jgi:hypothetical protein
MRHARALILVLIISVAARAAANDFPKQGLVLWLNAGQAVLENGRVTQLIDLSGKENHARHDRDPRNVLDNPTIVRNATNGQPVLRFSGKYSSFTFPRISDIRTVFWVVNKDPKAFKQKQELFVLGDAKSLDFHPGTHFTDTILHATTQYGSPALQKGQAWLNGGSIDARKTDFPQKLSVITLLATGNVEANQVAKDRQFPDRCWQGDIAEILLFNRSLEDAERQAVEQYLMRKYGIAGSTTRSTPPAPYPNALAVADVLITDIKPDRASENLHSGLMVGALVRRINAVLAALPESGCEVVEIATKKPVEAAESQGVVRFSGKQGVSYRVSKK